MAPSARSAAKSRAARMASAREVRTGMRAAVVTVTPEGAVSVGMEKLPSAEQATAPSGFHQASVKVKYYDQIYRLKNSPSPEPPKPPGHARAAAPAAESRGGASMPPGSQVTRSCRDTIAAGRDRGHRSARAPYPQAGRPAALHAVLHRDRRAGT